jgi:hypothetical protein
MSYKIIWSDVKTIVVYTDLKSTLFCEMGNLIENNWVTRREPRNFVELHAIYTVIIHHVIG